MNILLLILKIIGILLLIFLALLLIFLFHPVYYNIHGEIEEEVSVQAKLWWLFAIIRMEISVEAQTFLYKLKIFGKVIFSNENKTAEPKEEPVIIQPKAKEEYFLENFAESIEEQDTDNFAGEEPVNADTIGSIEPKMKKPKKSIKKSIEDILAKLQQIPSKLCECGQVADRIKTEFTDERNRLAVTHIWQECIYLLKKLKPKYLYADMQYSTGDPATTGQATGLLSLLPVIYQKNVHVYPDFTADKFYVQGKFGCKGNVQLFYILKIIIRMIRDKNILRMLRRIRTK